MRITTGIKNRIVQNIMDNIPNVDNANAMRQRAMAVAVSLLPVEVQKVYDNPLAREYVNWEYVHVHGTGYLLPCQYGDVGKRTLVTTIKSDPQWAALYMEHAVAKRAWAQVKYELEVSFKTITTVKAFKERFPDLVKYLPTSAAEVVSNLPATTNLMDNLKAAGLKVGEEKAEVGEEAGR